MGTARIFPTSLAATSHREFYFSLEGQVTQKIHIYGGICRPRRDSPNGLPRINSAEELDLISDDLEPRPLPGQPWRAVKDYPEWPTPSFQITANACRLNSVVPADSASSPSLGHSSLSASAIGLNELECTSIGPRANPRKAIRFRILRTHRDKRKLSRNSVASLRCQE